MEHVRFPVNGTNLAMQGERRVTRDKLNFLQKSTYRGIKFLATATYPTTSQQHWNQIRSLQSATCQHAQQLSLVRHPRSFNSLQKSINPSIKAVNFLAIRNRDVQYPRWASWALSKSRGAARTRRWRRTCGRAGGWQIYRPSPQAEPPRGRCT